MPTNEGMTSRINSYATHYSSVGANYIEANEALSKKDFIMRIKICRKEAKESRYWLRIINTGASKSLANKCQHLARESQELMNIFGAILRNSV